MIGENFDVYSHPLVHELQEIWARIPAYDVQKPLGYRSFTLRGVLLWTIHDFHGCGIVIGVAKPRVRYMPYMQAKIKG